MLLLLAIILAIAWIFREDYARAGFPMLPVIEPDGLSTARQSVIYAAALVPLSPDDAGMAISDNLLPGVKYAQVGDGGWVINVHDPRDSTLYTSCGNVR